jgi:hypothetical protein
MDKKFSTLLRLGAKQVIQTTGTYLDPNTRDNDKVQAACAIGMMAVGRAGTTDYQACRVALNEIISYLDDKESYMKAQIICWNDTNCLSADQIAEHLEAKGH